MTGLDTNDYNVVGYEVVRFNCSFIRTTQGESNTTFVTTIASRSIQPQAETKAH